MNLFQKANAFYTDNQETVQRWVCFCLMAALIIAMLVTHRFIFMMGDDFTYALFGSGGFAYFVNRHVEHYMLSNGRALVHLAATALLLFEVYLWRFLNPFIIAVLTWLIARVSSQGSRASLFALLASMLIIISISVDITSEAVFWLTGSMNFLLPSVAFMLSWRLFHRHRENRSSKALGVTLPIITFLSAATIEQAGLVCIGLLITAAFVQRFKNKQTLLKAQIVSIFTAIAGYLTVIFAPGIHVRIDYSSIEITLEWAADVLRLFMIESQTFYFVIALALSMLIWLIYYKKFIACVVLSALLAAHLLSLQIFYENDIAFILFFSAFAAMTIYAFGLVLIIEGDGRPLIFAGMALGSQIMLIAADGLMQRTLFVTIVLMSVPIIVTAEKFRKYIPLPIVAAIIAPLGFIGISNTSSIITGYANNAPTHRANLEIIREFQNNLEPGAMIYLNRLPDDRFGHHPMHAYPYHLWLLKQFFSLPERSVLMRYEASEQGHSLFINDTLIYVEIHYDHEHRRLYLPLGDLANRLGLDVTWHGPERKISVSCNETHIANLWSGSRIVYAGGNYHEIRSPVLFHNNRNFVPVDFFEGFLGLDIRADGGNVWIFYRNNSHTLEELSATIVAAGEFWNKWWASHHTFEWEHIDDSRRNWQPWDEGITPAHHPLSRGFAAILPSAGFIGLGDIGAHLSQFYTQDWINRGQFSEPEVIMQFIGNEYAAIFGFYGFEEYDGELFVFIQTEWAARPNWHTATHVLIEQDGGRAVVETIVSTYIQGYSGEMPAITYRFTFIDGKIESAGGRFE